MKKDALRNLTRKRIKIITSKIIQAKGRKHYMKRLKKKQIGNLIISKIYFFSKWYEINRQHMYVLRKITDYFQC